MRWTQEADDIVCEYGNKGPEEVRRQLRRQLGFEATVSAIKSHASREGMSLMRFEVCPGCGDAVRPSEMRASTGLCRVCHAKSLRDGVWAIRQRMDDPVAELERDEAERRYRREYDKLRKRKSRANGSTN